MNTTRTRESNIEKLVVKIIENTNNSSRIAGKESYPIIENITDNSITASMRDSSFNNLVCYSSGDEEVSKNSNGNNVTFDNLKSDTEYKIYAVDDNNRESNMITVKTFPDNATYLNKFKEYLNSNRGMLQNDYDKTVEQLDSLLKTDYELNEKFWPYDKIIDGVSELDNSLIKQELLLYAMNFENSMIEAYNMENPNKLNITRNDVFDTNFKVDNWNSVKYYSKKNNKNKLEDVLTDGKVFNGQPNKVYSLYGLDKDTSSIKQYVSVFSSEGKEFLNQYREVDKYKTLDLDSNKAIYPTLDLDELYAITIRDNLLCDRQLLEEPYVYIEDDKIYANVDYTDKVLLNDIYYLCISEIYSTLDVMPKRKETFTRQTKIINLNDKYIPFDPEKIYHFWIENSQGNVISKPFIFNYKKSPGLDKILDKELMTALDLKKRLLYDVISNHTAVNDVIYNLYCETVPKKDIDTKLELSMLQYGVQSRFVSNALKEFLYETVLVNVSNKLEVIRTNKIDIYKSNNQFKIQSGSDLDVKILVKSYNLESQETTCNIYNTNSLINTTGDYMSIFLINEYVDKVLGFIVLDCNNYQYKELGFEVKVGDK
jgi:hypothetical protein